MSPDTEQAIRMLDSFGARYFELTVNDLKGEKMATATTPHPEALCSKVLCPPDGACHADATMRGRLATRHAALDGFQHVVADIVADPVG